MSMVLPTSVATTEGEDSVITLSKSQYDRQIHVFGAMTVTKMTLYLMTLSLIPVSTTILHRGTLKNDSQHNDTQCNDTQNNGN